MNLVEVKMKITIKKEIKLLNNKAQITFVEVFNPLINKNKIKYSWSTDFFVKKIIADDCVIISRHVGSIDATNYIRCTYEQSNNKIIMIIRPHFRSYFNLVLIGGGLFIVFNALIGFIYLSSLVAITGILICLSLILLGRNKELNEIYAIIKLLYNQHEIELETLEDI